MVHLFIAFCNRLGLSYKRLSYVHYCWYIEYLARHAFTPGTISNHISHLRTFYKLADLPLAPLNHYRVGLALRAVAINVRHVPDPKDAASQAVLRAVLVQLREGPARLPTKLAILLMFMAFARQSSITPPTVSAFDATRHLTWRDAWLTPEGLSLRIKWTKTIQRSCDLKVILLPFTTDPELCPARTHQRYKGTRAAAQGHHPYLTFEDGNPLTTKFVARAWAQAVKAAGFDPSRLSLHILRRGGASYTYNQADAKLNDVMAQGTWRSLAVRDYIRPDSPTLNTVHKALKRI